MGKEGTLQRSPVSAFLRIVAILLVIGTAGVVDSRRAETGSGTGVRVALEPALASECPSGWVCVWEHADFEGQMVMFHDCCAWYDLADYGINNAVSSWRNRKSVDAKLATLANGDGDRLCLRSSSMDSALGPAWNDAGSSVKVFASDGAC
jgi:Peptidase inhibitor family I36